jgi:hypothetical protein
MGRSVGGILVVAGLLLASQGCAVVEDHNENFHPVYQSMMDGNFTATLGDEDFQKNKANKLDGLCYQLDAGILANLAGDYKRSIKEFEAANATMGFHEDRGTTVGSVTEQAGSILLNEKTIPYKGEGFEKILVSAYQAKNYLFDGSVSEAGVEVRACYEKQAFVKEQYDKELSEAEEKKKDPGVDKAVDFGKAYKDATSKVTYPELSSAESIYQLAYVEYLCQLVAERKEDIQEAKISAQKCYAIRPDLKFVAQDFIRLARAGGSAYQVKEVVEKNPGLKIPGKTEGSVAVLFEQGMAPHKEEFAIVFPIRTGVGKFALPLYHTSSDCHCGDKFHRNPGENVGAHVRLVVGDQTCESGVLTDLTTVAFRYHKDRMPLLITKAIIRTVLKAAAAEATHEGVKAAVGKKSGWGEAAGFAAGFAVSVAGAATEQADLRAWLSLPASFQAARVWLPQGEYPAKLELLDGSGNAIASEDLGTLKVKASAVRFVDARSLGRRFVVRSRHEEWDDQPLEQLKAPEKKPGKKPKAEQTENLAKPDAPADKPKKKPAKPTEKTEDLAKPDAPADAPKKPAKSDEKTSNEAKPDAPADKAPAKSDEKTTGEAKPDAPKPDAPKPDAPKPDAPKPDAPKPDAPKPDAPKPDAPPADAPKADAPKDDKKGDGSDPLAPPKGE